MKKINIKQALQQQPILPLFYHDDAAVCIDIMQALYNGGIRVIEFTNRGTQAINNVAALIQYRNTHLKDLMIGVGTVGTTQKVLAFIDVGADFLISPFFDSAICKTARNNNIDWIPGCMTPTDIHAASHAGCGMIKLFPGDLLGTGFLKAVTPLFPGINFVITGGVDASVSSINSWLQSGAMAVGLGSKLITSELLQSGKYHLLSSTVAQLLKALSAK
jgi:2-dehydro-3-deoxyphosphogluconate aldolase / (4S)-4-hydroxy-2-oxoglutarate aldolase